MTDEQILERGREATEPRLHRAAHRRRPAPPAAVRVVSRRRPHHPRRVPDLHLKAYTAVEWDWFARLTGRPTKDLLAEMKDAGLGSLPGGGAEIFHPEVRDKICEHKADAEQWLRVHREAHELGLQVERHDALRPHREGRAPHRPPDPPARASGRDRRLPDVHPAGVPPGQQHARPGIPKPSGMMDLQDDGHQPADARQLPAHQGLLGDARHQTAQVALSFGADDIDGTVVHEKIYHEAGSDSPQELTVADIRRLIEEAGRTPVERDTLYHEVVRESGTQWKKGRKLLALA